MFIRLPYGIESVMMTLPFVIAGCNNHGDSPGGPDEGQNVVTESTHDAKFTEQGEFIRPQDWREWIFVGMPVTPNALNDGKAVLPEAQAVYIDPASWDHWKETGAFRDGTMFAVELTMLKSEMAHPDGSTTQLTGRGFFQEGFSGLQFAVKDSAQFPGEPGNWAYFSSRIGAEENDYPELMALLPTNACNSCHEENGGQDWVFTQFYPVLRSAKPETNQ